MSAQEIAAALSDLRVLTTCRCHEAWTDRGLHGTHCLAEYREDVETLADALSAPSGDAGGERAHRDGTAAQGSSQGNEGRHE